MYRYLYPILLFAAFLVIMAIPDPDFLRNVLIEGFLIAVIVLLPLHFIFGNREYKDPHPVTGFLMIGFAGIVLTAMFWFRASAGSYGFETGMGIDIARAFFFWVPAVLFACLYRSAGEGWRPGRRGHLFLRIVAAILGGLAGLALQNLLRAQIDSIPMDQSLHHVERHLPPDGSRIVFRHERKTLLLDVDLGADYQETNIRSLRRLRSVSGHAANLTSRKDTDSLSLRIMRDGTLLASLNWPDQAETRPADRIHYMYDGTGLSDVPDSTDMYELFDGIEAVFRPVNLAAGMDGNTLILKWTGDPAIPDDAASIPEIVHDWQAANRTIMHAVSLFRGIESYRIEMPGHTLLIPADSVRGRFLAQRLIRWPDISAVIQLYDSDEFPDYDPQPGSGPVRIILGDGEFDTQRNSTGPLWPWEQGILAGHHFYVTHIHHNGTVRIAIHPAGRPEETRLYSLQPGDKTTLFTLHARYIEGLQIDSSLNN